MTFRDFAMQEGISLEHKDDYEIWLFCWREAQKEQRLIDIEILHKQPKVDGNDVIDLYDTESSILNQETIIKI